MNEFFDSPGKVILAPLAGVTDRAFRELCRTMGADGCVTEMVSCKGIFYGDKKTHSLLYAGQAEQPCGIQLFGSDCEAVRYAVGKVREEYRPPWIDFNMGCPVPKIVKNGDGSALMKNLLLASEVLKTAVDAAGPIPVTVKFRLGFSSDVSLEFGRMAQDAGVCAVCLHARTREQMYSGTADWSAIRRLKENLTVPVTGNGDVFTPEDAIEMRNQTGCDHVMVARGALGNPFLFRQISQLRQTGRYDVPSPSEKLEAARRFLSLILAYKPAEIAVGEAKKQLAWFLKGLSGAALCRTRIFAATTEIELRTVLDDYENETFLKNNY